MSALYLVWSKEHQMWWRPNRSGYTGHIEEAGRYTHADATQIVASATCNGALNHSRVNPVTGHEYVQASEVMVPAPETGGDGAYEAGRRDGMVALAEELVAVRDTYNAVQTAGERVQP